MAKQRVPEHVHHAFRMVEEEMELVLVGFGRRSYIWVGPVSGADAKEIYTFSGPKTLRKLAEAILTEIPARKR